MMVECLVLKQLDVREEVVMDSSSLVKSCVGKIELSTCPIWQGLAKLL